jgi:hypothetical protein
VDQPSEVRHFLRLWSALSRAVSAEEPAGASPGFYSAAHTTTVSRADADRRDEAD